MASKILLGITVALCAFVSSGLHASPLDRTQMSFPNVTEILLRFKELMIEIEEKTEQVGDEIESAVDFALAKIEDDADKAVQRWNATVERWVNIATRDGADIQVCLKGLEPLSGLAQDLEVDAKECLNEHMGDVTAAVQALKDLAPTAVPVIREDEAEVQECLAKDDVPAIGLCLMTVLPKVKVEEAKIAAEAVVMAAKAGGEAAALVPLAAVCTAEATAARSAQASVIIDQTVTCIRSALAQ